MKIKKSILNYLIFTLFLILSSQAANLKSSDKKHPNVGEITSEYQKMVKPFYQKEYFPKEVSSINEPKPAYGNKDYLFRLYQSTNSWGTRDK